MAVNQSRSMSADFAQGTVDSSYISIMPDRGGVLGDIPHDRLSWPSYGQAESHREPKFATDCSCHAGKDVEHYRR
jgi:hypothetical protein